MRSAQQVFVEWMNNCLRDQFVLLRQAGTWDPLLQCLHLDECLLKKQNAKKLWCIKIIACVPIWEKLWTVRYYEKTKDPEEELGAKAGYCTCMLHTAPPNRWADHVNHPSGLIPGPTPSLPYLRNQLTPFWRAREQKNLLLVLVPP